MQLKYAYMHAIRYIITICYTLHNMLYIVFNAILGLVNGISCVKMS